MREKAHRWVDRSTDQAKYAEVDRRRAMGGVITPPVLAVDSKSANSDLPVFGAKFREQYWAFEEGWNNINHGTSGFGDTGNTQAHEAFDKGAYGAAPIPVIKQMRELNDRNSAAPDRWMRDERLGYIKASRDLRARLGDFVGCEAGDIVM